MAKDKFKRILRSFLRVSSVILTLSSLMDYLLWFTINYHVPSWTIATMSLMSAVLCEVIRRLI